MVVVDLLGFVGCGGFVIGVGWLVVCVWSLFGQLVPLMILALGWLDWVFFEVCSESDGAEQLVCVEFEISLRFDDFSEV